MAKEAVKRTNKASKRRFRGIKGVVEGYSRRTLTLIIILNLFLAAAVIGGVWYYLAHRQKPLQLDPQDPYAKRIQAIEQKPLPKEPMDQAVYYSDIASNYEALKLNDKALQYFLKAQEVVDRNNLHDSINFYRSIGDLYLKQNNKKKAKEYYSKEIARLEDYKKRHPEEAVTVDKIIQQLKEKNKDL